ncbi:MAG TPA: hypothetical protein VN611_12495, partial [Patescibacteria group bacterium]|nr:hypothetical protein [Patescibacteria group bacterium]
MLPGWVTVVAQLMPPSGLMVEDWRGGAFIIQLNVTVNGVANPRLLVCVLINALCFIFFIRKFLVEYRI